MGTSIDRDEIADEDYERGDDLKKIEKRFEELRQFNRTLNKSRDESVRDESIMLIDTLKHETIELVANQMYNKLINLFNHTRKRLGVLKVYVEPF